MLFQRLVLLVAKLDRIVFDRNGALFLPCAQFKNCAGLAVLTQGLIILGVLYSVGAHAQESTVAGISLAIDGQAPPELDLGWQEPATSPVPITGYFLFRATSSNGPFSQLNSTAQTQTSYVDTSVQNG